MGKMKHIKLFELYDQEVEVEGNMPTTKELYNMFTAINKDIDATGGQVMPLTDVEYYTEQINNIFFNNVTGEDDFEAAEQMAKDMAQAAKKG